MELCLNLQIFGEMAQESLVLRRTPSILPKREITDEQVHFERPASVESRSLLRIHFIVLAERSNPGEKREENKRVIECPRRYELQR